MKDIFLSYRRSDSSTITGRIHDHLRLKFGAQRLFKDVDSIPAGADFRDVVTDAVAQCKVFIAVIGDDWLEQTDSDGRRRIDNPDDYVHLEIATALQRGIPVIPVLVDGTPLPGAADLPPPLQPLSYRQAIPVRPDPDFRHDIERLCNELAPHVRVGLAWPRHARWLAASALLLAVLAFVASLFGIFGRRIPANADPCDERYVDLLFVPQEKIDAYVPEGPPPETLKMTDERPDAPAHLRIVNQTGKAIRIWRYIPAADLSNAVEVKADGAPAETSPDDAQSWLSTQVCSSTSDNLQATGGWSFIYVEDLHFSLDRIARGASLDNWFMPTRLGWVYLPYGKDSPLILKPNFFEDPTQFVAPGQ